MKNICHILLVLILASAWVAAPYTVARIAPDQQAAESCCCCEGCADADTSSCCDQPADADHGTCKSKCGGPKCTCSPVTGLAMLLPANSKLNDPFSRQGRLTFNNERLASVTVGDIFHPPRG